MANGKAMGPDELPAELLKLGLSDSSHEIFLAFHGIIVAVMNDGGSTAGVEIRNHKSVT